MENHSICSVLFPTRKRGARFKVELIITELRSLKPQWEDCLFGEGAHMGWKEGATMLTGSAGSQLPRSHW